MTSGRDFSNNDGALWNVAFWFWFITSLKITFVALFFRSAPAVGTLFNFLISIAFLFFVFFKWLSISRRVDFSSAAKWVYAYIVWAGFSVLWTKADSSAIAAFYWVGVVLDVVVVWFMLQSGERGKIIEGSLHGIVFSGFVLGFLLLFFFKTGVDGRVEDEIIHVNSIGSQIGLSCIASLFFIARIIEKRGAVGKWYGTTVFLLSCLIYSFSKTSIIAAVIAIVFYALISKGVKGQSIALLSVGALILMLFWPFIQPFVNAYIQVDESSYTSSAETLSGRTVLWENVWDMIWQAPIAGYGYFSFRDVSPDIFIIAVPHAHNEFLQQWFSTGIVGVVITLAIYSVAGRYWWRISQHFSGMEINYAAVALAFLIYSIARGVTEASAVSLVYPLPLILLFLSRSKDPV